MTAPAQRPAAEAAEQDSDLIIVEGLIKHFPIRAGILRRQVGAVQAVDGLNFAVKRGETFSIVGESGCGKSTTARLLTRLLEPTSGKITLRGPRHHPSQGCAVAAVAARHANDLPRPLLIAESTAHCRQDRRRPIPDSGRVAARAESRKRYRSCSLRSGSTRSTTTAIPTSSPGVSGSGSALPELLRCAPGSSLPTSRSRPWTSRFRRRSSTFWRTCRKNST